MNNLNDSQGKGKCVAPASQSLSHVSTFLSDNKLFQMPCLYKLLQMIFQHTILLNGMAFLPVVHAIQTLIPSSWVLAHLLRPSEIQFTLDAFEDFVGRFFEGHINTLGSWCHTQHPLGSSLNVLVATCSFPPPISLYNS